MKTYRHLFFDLDRTLWDFERNAADTLKEVFGEFELQSKGVPEASAFIGIYREKNNEMWAAYRKNKISKAELRLERFRQTLLHFGYDDADFALRLNDEYVSRCSIKTRLIPYTKELLQYLSKKYELHVITNGFKEAQGVKLERSGILPYFKEVVISDGTGFKKPDAKLFHLALERANAEVGESMIIGDDYDADIEGARAIGMDQIYFRSAPINGHFATYEVAHLKEITEIL